MRIFTHPLVEAELDHEMLIRFGEPGQTEIAVEAVDWATEETYQDSFMITVTEAPSPTLSMSQRVSDDEVATGQEITYTLTISNSGPGIATNTRIMDSWTAGMTFMTDSIRATGLSAGTLGTTPPILAEGITMQPNDVLEISFVTTINQDITTQQRPNP